MTHIHGDHFSPATIEAVLPANVKPLLIVPKSVAQKIPENLQSMVTVEVVANGEKMDADGITVAAVPAYNITPGKEKFHPKGRDNGYVLTMGGTKVYIAGVTEDIPAMRALKDIDAAFVPMNLPYTMDVTKAADAIRAFKPKIVYPYHYRSSDSKKADIDELKPLVGTDGGVEIRARDWYPE